MRVVLEGLDGTGKTHFGSRAAKLLELPYTHTPHPELAGECEALKTQGLHSAAFFLYLSSCARAGETAPDGQLIDRYGFSSVQSYGWHAGLSAQETAKLGECIFDVLPAPDIMIFLTANLEVRERRLTGKGAVFRPASFEEHWHEVARLMTSGRLSKLSCWLNTSSWTDEEGAYHLKDAICAGFEKNDANWRSPLLNNLAMGA